MKVTVKTASRMVNKSPKTLYSHIKKGKLSVGRDNNGDISIDTSELVRVYGEILSTPEKEQPKKSVEQLESELQKVNARLEKLVGGYTHLKDQNALLKQLVADARSRERAATEREQTITNRYEKMITILERMLPSKS